MRDYIHEREWSKEVPAASTAEALEQMSEIKKSVILTRWGALPIALPRLWMRPLGRLLASQFWKKAWEVKARPVRWRIN
jgi:hypothetical protein